MNSHFSPSDVIGHTEEQNLTSNDILMEYARERHSNRDLKNPYEKEREERTYHFDPKSFGDFPKTEDELVKKLGRKWKISLCMMGSFFEEYKSITSNYIEHPEREVTVLRLSTRHSNLLSIFKSSQQVSRLFKKLMKVGGLVCVDDEYRFNRGSRNLNVCRAYAYNKFIEKLVLGMVKRYNLEIRNQGEHDEDISLCHTFDMEQYYKVEIKSRTRIPNLTTDQCRAILNRKYGGLLKPRMEKIAEMNLNLPAEQRIRMDWNIEESATHFIKSIGIRATSAIVSTKAHHEENPNFTGVWRNDYLNEYFGRTKWFEFDVHGSVYMITHLLNYGEWLGNEVDPYVEMFGEQFHSKEDRDAYKSMCMCLYFDSIGSIINNNKWKTPKTIGKYEKTGLQPVINNAEESMYGFTGKKFRSAIFFHESLLYVDFVYELRKRGIRVVQIYDGFYLRIGSVTEEELDDLMGKCAVKYLDDYRKWIAEKWTGK